MKIYEWQSKRITDADFFIRFTPEEIRELDKIFPCASSICREFEGFFYGFADLDRKRFIPLKNPHYAFGGCYVDYPPFKKEELEVSIDLAELTWQEDVDMDMRK